MFNLDVAELDNYYVGEHGWLVHNCSRAQIEAIADHAFNKHVFQQKDLSRLGASTPEQLANVIEQGISRAINSPIGDKVKVLDLNRTAYFDPLHGTITIVDARPGLGTIYKPDGGFPDFLRLR